MEPNNCHRWLRRGEAGAGQVQVTTCQAAHPRIIYSGPGRVWFVTFRLGTGKTLTFLTPHYTGHYLVGGREACRD